MRFRDFFCRNDAKPFRLFGFRLFNLGGWTLNLRRHKK